MLPHAPATRASAAVPVRSTRRPNNLIGHTGRNVTPSDGLELFFFLFFFFPPLLPPPPHSPQEQSGVGGGNFLENKLTSPRHPLPPSQPPPPPPPPPLLASPPERVSLSLCLHMKVIDLGLYDLFIDTKTALRWGGGREGERERTGPTTRHNSLSSAPHFLPYHRPSHLLPFLPFFFF